MTLLLVLLLAALLGFTAHRAGICAVKAVKEVITTRRAHMLASFGKTVLWIMTVILIIMWLAPGHLMPLFLAPSLLSIGGGFVFGVGAALNGGCAISTVTRLGNGELRMLLTIVGIVLSIAAIDDGFFTLPAVTSRQPSHPFVISGWGPSLALAALSSWAVWEAVSLWRTRDRTCGLIDGLLHRPWRLSSAAAVIGLADVTIALVAGRWAYTGTVRDTVDPRSAGGTGPSLLHIIFFR